MKGTKKSFEMMKPEIVRIIWYLCRHFIADEGVNFKTFSTYCI